MSANPETSRVGFRHDVNDIIQEYIHKKKFEDTKRSSQRRTSKKETSRVGFNMPA
jgi:hypothetical protein